MEHNLLKEHYPKECALLTIPVRGKAAAGHTDTEDSKRTMAMETTMGVYSGGDFVLPTLGIRFKIGII